MNNEALTEDMDKKLILARLGKVINESKDNKAVIAAVSEYARIKNWTTSRKIETTVKQLSPFEIYMNKRKKEKQT